MTNILPFGRRDFVPSTRSTETSTRKPFGPYTRRKGSMHTFAFRSRSAILEADEAELIRDICCDPDKAQTKLRKIQERLKGVREHAAEQIELLTAAETKLSAAIVAALLSTSKEG